MAKDRSLVRASDLGTWQFCQRAWWLANVKGAVHQHPERLTQGDVAHAAHGQTVRQAARLRTAALVLLAVALLLLAIALLWSLA